MGDSEGIWLERVSAARGRGDHLAAFDLACAGLAAVPNSLPLHYNAILALARAGATRNARMRLERLRDSGALDRVEDRRLALDMAALDGRLHKDLWAQSDGEMACDHARRSAEAYAAAFECFDQSYPAANAATMFLAAGEEDLALRYAQAAIDLASTEPSSYWADVTVAEAALILRDAERAAAALDRAAARRPGLDEVAATRRQIRLLAEMMGFDAGIVRRLPVPTIGYWLDDDADDARCAGAVAQANRIEIIYGILVRPQDVHLAMTFIAQGAEVSLVLPCEASFWFDVPGADNVREVFAHVVERATSILTVTREGRRDDPAALHLCRQQARGLAKLRASHLAVSACRIVWLGSDVEVPTLEVDTPVVNMPALVPVPDGRRPHAIVFGDVMGFSRLNEKAQLVFLDAIVGGFASVLDRLGSVEYAETAGDGIYLVLADVETAARCCLGLREVLEPARVAAHGLPAHLGLRLGVHIGPIYKRFDRVIGKMKFCGAEVVRTARIEPITPVGEIYVTEQFAAVLADASGDRYECEYAGMQPMAKGYGTCRMYALHPARGCNSL